MRPMVDMGADPNAMTDDGYTPLYLAAVFEHKKMALALAAVGADPSMTIPRAFRGVRADPPPSCSARTDTSCVAAAVLQAPESALDLARYCWGDACANDMEVRECPSHVVGPCADGAACAPCVVRDIRATAHTTSFCVLCLCLRSFVCQDAFASSQIIPK